MEAPWVADVIGLDCFVLVSLISLDRKSRLSRFSDVSSVPSGGSVEVLAVSTASLYSFRLEHQLNLLHLP